MTRPNYLSALLLALMTIGSSQAAEQSSNPFVKFIQRTMRSLARERNPGEKIRILFYGQSITAQRWRDHVVADLKKRFPEANLEIQNRAIGGFKSPALRRTAEHDLYPFYPDLLIFHVYGDLVNYEAIIRKVRETTTAEMVLWTDHVAHPDRMERDDQYSAGIRRIAQKHDCMLVENGSWTVTACLGDAEHPQPGQYLTIEGGTVAENVDTPAGRFRELSTTVNVNDGTLTATIGTPKGGSNTCINWLVVEPADK